MSQQKCINYAKFNNFVTGKPRVEKIQWICVSTTGDNQEKNGSVIYIKTALSCLFKLIFRFQKLEAIPKF